jgi:hypothetical protein
VVQQLLRLASIFACNPIDGTENPQCAQSNVFQIADGGCDEIQAGGEWLGGPSLVRVSQVAFFIFCCVERSRVFVGHRG